MSVPPPLSEIRELPEATWKGFVLDFKYSTSEYYDIDRRTDTPFSIRLVRKPFENTQIKHFEGHLYSDYLDDPTAFGLYENGEIVGFLEIEREKWHNRLRITELLILPGYRNMGYGKLLMEKAKSISKTEGFREIVLETQTCNTMAIDFYFSQGFQVNGIDLSSYTNEDIQAKEVRLELTYQDEFGKN